jgi:aldose sugar dehydrogenase
MKKIVVFAVIMPMAIVIASVSFVAAFAIQSYQGTPFDQAKVIGHTAGGWITRQLAKVVTIPTGRSIAASKPSTKNDLKFSTIFMDISVESVTLPQPSRYGHGGAALSWGDYVLVLNHAGTFYLVDSELNVEQSGLEAPESGLEDYFSTAMNAPWDQYSRRKDPFRYNDIVHYRTDSEQGLLISYTKFNGEGSCYTNAVARLAIHQEIEGPRQLVASADDWLPLYASDPCLPLKKQGKVIDGHIAGGAIVFDGKNTVYLANGDFHWDGMGGSRFRPGADPATSLPMARDPHSDYGKVVAIDIHSGNYHHISKGHRNIQGMAFDKQDRIWAIEQGQRGGDELNLIKAGGDYGWPDVGYGTHYTGFPLADANSFGRHDGFEKPIFAWLPSIATSTLSYIEGFHDSWDGDWLVGSLKGDQLVRVRVQGDRAIFAEKIDVGRAVRHIHQRADGKIVLWTKRQEVMFLTPLERLEPISD